MTDREFDVLCAAGAADGKRLSLEELGEAIAGYGPRTARQYAAESAWALYQSGLLEASDLKRKGRCYSITDYGRQVLSAYMTTFQLTETTP